jgi:DNA-binding transcriptional regulator YiaG
MTGKRFKQIRLALGLSQAQLAKVLGVQKNTVALWDRGVNPIKGPLALCMKLLLEKHQRGQLN